VGGLTMTTKMEVMMNKMHASRGRGVLWQWLIAMAISMPMMGPLGEMPAAHYCPKLGTGIDPMFFFDRRGLAPSL
jgi:hypothetical protein